MIFGIGVDVIELARMEKALTMPGFAQRILTPGECAEFNRAARKTEFAASRWAAKEAVSKALGTGIGGNCSFQDVEIRHRDSGAPVAILSGNAAQFAKTNGIDRIHLSLSHERGVATAFAVAEKNGTE